MEDMNAARPLAHHVAEKRYVSSNGKCARCSLTYPIENWHMSRLSSEERRTSMKSPCSLKRDSRIYEIDCGLVGDLRQSGIIAQSVAGMKLMPYFPNKCLYWPLSALT